MAGRYGMRKEKKIKSNNDTFVSDPGTMQGRYSSRENYILPQGNRGSGGFDNMMFRASGFGNGNISNSIDYYQQREDARRRREEEERQRNMHDTYVYESNKEAKYLSNDVYNPNNATYNFYYAPSYTASQYVDYSYTSYTDYSYTNYTDYSYTNYTDYSSYSYSTYYYG